MRSSRAASSGFPPRATRRRRSWRRCWACSTPTGTRPPRAARRSAPADRGRRSWRWARPRRVAAVAAWLAAPGPPARRRPAPQPSPGVDPHRELQERDPRPGLLRRSGSSRRSTVGVEGALLFVTALPAQRRHEAGRAARRPTRRSTRTAARLVSIREGIDVTVWLGFIAQDGVRATSSAIQAVDPSDGELPTGRGTPRPPARTRAARRRQGRRRTCAAPWATPPSGSA